MKIIPINTNEAVIQMIKRVESNVEDLTTSSDTQTISQTTTTTSSTSSTSK
jgi:hypothetical protein